MVFGMREEGIVYHKYWRKHYLIQHVLISKRFCVHPTILIEESCVHSFASLTGSISTREEQFTFISQIIIIESNTLSLP